MENKEIIEGNKLIAEFDNRIKLKKCKVNGFYPDGYEYIGFLPTDIGNTRGINDLKYHTSWDWIMPVVEKIEDYGYIVYIKQEICYIRNKTNSIKNLVYMCHYPKITAVFMVVVEFIKWYNENKDNGK